MNESISSEFYHLNFISIFLSAISPKQFCVNVFIFFVLKKYPFIKNEHIPDERV
jgi:hypothetical protein